MSHVYHFGLMPTKTPRVTLRPLRHLSTDIRDHHLIARWKRLCRRWMRPHG
jgi:hypothetical protein